MFGSFIKRMNALVGDAQHFRTSVQEHNTPRSHSRTLFKTATPNETNTEVALKKLKEVALEGIRSGLVGVGGGPLTPPELVALEGIPSGLVGVGGGPLTPP